MRCVVCGDHRSPGQCCADCHRAHDWVNRDRLPKVDHKAMRSRRYALGLSQEDLATHIGCSLSAVSHWENGRGRPASSDWFQRWHEVLELPNPKKLRIGA